MSMNKRIAISLDPETRAVVARLARARGMARSQVISQLLAGMRPQLRQLAEAFEQAIHDPEGAMQRLNSAADAAKVQLDDARQAHRFRVEDLATGEPWKPGLTWTEDSADRALAQARKGDPGREWILRQVG